jgi:hypothetical protein
MIHYSSSAQQLTLAAFTGHDLKKIKGLDTKPTVTAAAAADGVVAKGCLVNWLVQFCTASVNLLPPFLYSSHTHPFLGLGEWVEFRHERVELTRL